MGSQTGTPTSGGNLDTLRRKLVEKTGHFELVTDYENNDYSDDGSHGANDLLNEAQDLLDEMLDHPTQPRWLIKELTAASAPVLVQLQNAWYVTEVWFSGATSGRFMLEKSTVARIRDADNPKTNAWANAVALLAPEIEGSSSGTFTEATSNVDYIDFTDNELLTSMLVNPPYDEAYTLEIKAAFRHATISDANPATFWTQAPKQRILLDACRYLIETDHRNTQGQNDLFAALRLRVQQIYHRLVDESQQGPPELFRVIA